MNFFFSVFGTISFTLTLDVTCGVLCVVDNELFAVDCFSASDEDRSSWGPHNEFVWHSESELGGVGFTGATDIEYPGSGYIIDFPAVDHPNSTELATALLQRMIDVHWI